MLRSIFKNSTLMIIICSLNSLVYAANCDCTQKVGKCSGAINFLKKFGSPPSFGAEFEVYSSEKSCSSVEYFIDNLPRQTILSNKNKEIESTFGTKPINKDSIVYSACYVCKNLEDKNNQSNSRSSENDSPFNGRWTSTDRNVMGFKNTSTYDVSVKNNHITGSYSGTAGNGTISGTVNGNQAIISCSGCFTVKWNLVDDKTIKFSYPFGSGTLRKE